MTSLTSFGPTVVDKPVLSSSSHFLRQSTQPDIMVRTTPSVQSSKHIFHTYSHQLREKSGYFDKALDSMDWALREHLPISLTDIESDVFALVLKYIQNENIDINALDAQMTLDLLVAVCKLRIKGNLIDLLDTHFQITHGRWLQENLNLVYNSLKPHFKQLTYISSYCEILFSNYPIEFIFAKDFTRLTKDTLISLFKNNLPISEMVKWNKALEWGKIQARLTECPRIIPESVEHWRPIHFHAVGKEIVEVVVYIKFWDLQYNEFMTHVRPFSKSIPRDIYLRALRVQIKENRRAQTQSVITESGLPSIKVTASTPTLASIEMKRTKSNSSDIHSNRSTLCGSVTSGATTMVGTVNEEIVLDDANVVSYIGNEVEKEKPADGDGLKNDVQTRKQRRRRPKNIKPLVSKSKKGDYDIIDKENAQSPNNIDNENTQCSMKVDKENGHCPNCIAKPNSVRPSRKHKRLLERSSTVPASGLGAFLVHVRTNDNREKLLLVKQRSDTDGNGSMGRESEYIEEAEIVEEVDGVMVIKGGGASRSRKGRKRRRNDGNTKTGKKPHSPSEEDITTPTKDVFQRKFSSSIITNVHPFVQEDSTCVSSHQHSLRAPPRPKREPTSKNLKCITSKGSNDCHYSDEFALTPGTSVYPHDLNVSCESAHLFEQECLPLLASWIDESLGLGDSHEYKQRQQRIHEITDEEDCAQTPTSVYFSAPSSPISSPFDFFPSSPFSKAFSDDQSPLPSPLALPRMPVPAHQHVSRLPQPSLTIHLLYNTALHSPTLSAFHPRRDNVGVTATVVEPRLSSVFFGGYNPFSRSSLPEHKRKNARNTGVFSKSKDELNYQEKAAVIGSRV
ncbi:10280_t:CDS:2 [Paraglomus brasilianum]|uniref:10280_t:CDS:1 n=1 Tax=Paraglomus brasilianum TaxID=144538 RepID=A0A9N8WB42_9GLOM|nr:10280_t:CDS:2 [Paraglomus brasilianum]